MDLTRLSAALNHHLLAVGELALPLQQKKVAGLCTSPPLYQSAQGNSVIEPLSRARVPSSVPHLTHPICNDRGQLKGAQTINCKLIRIESNDNNIPKKELKQVRSDLPFTTF